MSRRIGLVLATSAGGVGQHVRSLGAHLVDAGNSVVVCGASPAEAMFSFSSVGAEFRPADIAVGIKPFADIRAVLALRHHLRDVDIIHAHGYRAGFLASYARRSHQPLVVTWHNILMAKGVRHAVLSQLEKRVARRADITLGASDDLVERARELGASDARFIPVAAPALAPPSRSVADIRAECGARERPLVVAVGRLHEQKAFDVLIRAAMLWKSHKPIPKVAIVGDGPRRAELEALAAKCDVDVTFMGHRNDVANVLAAGDVVVTTSIWEARPLVAQEALRMGRPLVATTVGGTPELVGDAALLVPPSNVEAVANAVDDVLGNPALATSLGEKGIKRAAEWPSEREMVSMIQGIYAELLGKLELCG